LLLPSPGSLQPVGSRFRTANLRDCTLLLRLAPFQRFAVIYWRSAGLSLSTIGLLWSESVMAEVLVFLLIGPWLIRRIGPGGGCGLAAAAGVIRWSILACHPPHPSCWRLLSPCTG
jgi:PPP family 3-phenylpropionic acid transporter